MYRNRRVTMNNVPDKIENYACDKQDVNDGDLTFNRPTLDFELDNYEIVFGRHYFTSTKLFT